MIRLYNKNEIRCNEMKVIGLIGCGVWGSNILRDLLKLNCKIYVVDINENVRLKASANGASQCCSTIDQLPICDGYIVATPIPQLAKVCADLLVHKKPIFSEKTLCLSLDDYELLKNLGGSDYIYAMHKWHYHPGIEALRVIAHSGKIGELKQLFTTRYGWVNDFHGGDVFWTQAIHDLTIVKHILGYIPSKIKAIDIVKDEKELPISFTAMLGDSPTVILSVSGKHSTKKSSVCIQGNKGCAELHDAYDDHITVMNDTGREDISIDTTFPLYLELKEFVEYLHNGPKPRCNLENAKEITEAILNLNKIRKADL